jgi:VIT1/CCC1 family predicted Fe2+/Mn2+ transporter
MRYDDTEVRSEAWHVATEPHGANLADHLNWLRAGVLGANDGIVSTTGLIVGVAAATTDAATIFTAGFAGPVAGAVSMALGGALAMIVTYGIGQIVGTGL